MIQRKNKYRVLGLMSGTSLDGLDLADCTIYRENGRWSFVINSGITIKYTEDILELLRNGIDLSESQIDELDYLLGDLFGQACLTFDLDTLDFIASHGHTIKHRPDLGYTLQIGNAERIAELTNKDVIADFRSLDVKLGGQGAPLVPIGDRDLFHDYGACINLGGFANISLDKKGSRIAWDICAVNVVLNRLARLLKLEYDDEGKLARSGKILPDLLDKLNNINYYNSPAPKSLGMEWVESEISGLLDEKQYSVKDLLNTYLEHISLQISNAIPDNTDKVLCTGGGTFNSYLIEKIQSKTDSEIVIPPSIIIDYKESLVFAYLGVLNVNKEINTLSSVTGASRDSIGGKLFEAYTS